jgi:hypothetical protein
MTRARTSAAVIGTLCLVLATLSFSKSPASSTESSAVPLIHGQAPHTLQCESAATGSVTMEPNGDTHLPAAPAVFLSVEVPRGGTPTSLTMFAIPYGFPSWTQCTPGQPCARVAIFPTGLSLGSVSTSFDGNQSWAGLVTLVTTMPSTDHPDYFGGVGYAKLVVAYTIAAEECVSQGSWTINQNHPQPMALMMPEGKSLVGFDTFATEIPPKAVNLFPCDVYEAPGVYTFLNECNLTPPKPQKPGRIGFIPTLIKEFGMQANSTANSRGVEFVCSNASDDRRGCMARVRYK